MSLCQDKTVRTIDRLNKRYKNSPNLKILKELSFFIDSPPVLGGGSDNVSG